MRLDLYSQKHMSIGWLGIHGWLVCQAGVFTCSWRSPGFCLLWIMYSSGTCYKDTWRHQESYGLCIKLCYDLMVVIIVFVLWIFLWTLSCLARSIQPYTASLRICPYCTVTAYQKSSKCDTHPSEGHKATEKYWDDYLWITMRYVLTYVQLYISW